MEGKDIRWGQRFANYKRALARLGEAVEAEKLRPLSDLEKEGVIQRFEFTHELAWNVLKDFLEYQGFDGIYGSRDATRMAFERGIIENGEVWMDMIRSRNLSSHAYKEEIADKIFRKIIDQYFERFLQLRAKMQTIQTENR